MRSYCPKCGRIVEPGHRCGRDRSAEPWRGSYHGAAYARNRIAAIERTRGHCAACGCTCAERVGHRWRMRGGEVHHVVPLREGGDDSPANLVLLCRSCHRAADAERRRSGA